MVGGGDRPKDPPEPTALTVADDDRVPTGRYQRQPRPTPPPDIPGVHYHMPGPSWDDFAKEKFGHGITIGVLLGFCLAGLGGLLLWTLLTMQQ